MCDVDDEERRVDQAWAEEAEKREWLEWGRSARSSDMERMVDTSWKSDSS